MRYLVPPDVLQDKIMYLNAEMPDPISPTEVHPDDPGLVSDATMLAMYERLLHVRSTLTVGELFHAISEKYLSDRKATANELLRIAAIAAELFYAVASHRDATPEVKRNAHELFHRKPKPHVALQHWGLLDPNQ
jgi:hypothetical protein